MYFAQIGLCGASRARDGHLTTHSVGRAEALSVSETSGTGSSPSKDANSQTTMRTPTSSNYPSNGSSDPKKSSSSLPYVASGRPKTAAEAQALLDENGDAGASETIFGARLLKEQDGEEVWEHNAWSVAVRSPVESSV